MIFCSQTIYFDIPLSICVGIQSKWHVRSRYWWFHGEWTCCFSKFCHAKNQTIQNLIHQFYKEAPKEHCPEAALYSDTSFSRYKVQTRSRVLKPLRDWKITSGHRKDFTKNIIEIVEIQKLTQFTHFPGRYKGQTRSRTREISRHVLAQNHSNPYRQPRAGGPHPLILRRPSRIVQINIYYVIYINTPL